MSLAAICDLAPNIRIVADPITRRKTYIRPCDRCGNDRKVRNPRQRLNLCRDCRSVMSTAEVQKWG